MEEHHFYVKWISQRSAFYRVPANIPDVECGGGFYIRSLVNDIGKGKQKNELRIIIYRVMLLFDGRGNFLFFAFLSAG